MLRKKRKPSAGPGTIAGSKYCSDSISFLCGEQKHIGFELNIRLYYEDCLVAIFEDKTGTETRLFVAHRRQALHIESEIPRRSAGLCSSPAYQGNSTPLTPYLLRRLHVGTPREA
jgi:hypothetical protein